MEVAFSKQFKRSYSKRIEGTTSVALFKKSLAFFIENPFDAKLKSHKLSGKLKGLWSFTVEYDIRVVFYLTTDKPPKAIFIDIGTHDEVY